jgi:hypothetical protein
VGKSGETDNTSESKANMVKINAETTVSFDGNVDALLENIFGEVAIAA